MSSFLSKLNSAARGRDSVNISLRDRFFPYQQAQAEKMPMHYQCLKLIKEWEFVEQKTKVNGEDVTKDIRCLKRAHGLETLVPNQPLRPGVLNTLKEKGCDFLICIAMYNEGPFDVIKTLSGVVKNLEIFKKAKVNPKRIACMMICDGLNPFLQTYGNSTEFYKAFVDIERINEHYNVNSFKDIKIPGLDKDETEIAHCFEIETKMGDDEDTPLQLIWVIKEQNRRKLNTHLWFFEGFCEYIQPEYVMLLDVGTQPRRSALYRLYEAMVLDPKIAGCCGEIAPRDASMWSMIESAQVVEYKFAHIFDKALESLFGYITVLPGAFSAYRWEALQGNPLDEYFHSVRRPHEMDCFKSNIYLAEDRVLCMALVFKKGKDNILRYVKNSVAETDVPANLGNLLAQRRRWINGSWFALLDSLQKWEIIFYGNTHGCLRRCCFGMQMLYYVVNVFFSYFLVGSFFLSFGLLLRNQFPETVDGKDEVDDMFTLGDTLLKLYFTCLIVVFILSLGAPPKKVEEIYKMLSTIFAFYMFAALYFFVQFVRSDEFSTPVLMSTLITVAAFTIIPILHCTLFGILKRLVHYLLVTPTYINIFLIYAMCNLNDCSWGNRPDKMTPEETKKADEFAKFRTVWVTIWAILNAAVGYSLTLFDTVGDDSVDTPGYYYIYIIGIAGVSIILIRFFGGLFFWLIETFCKKTTIGSSYDDENEMYDEADDREISSKAKSGVEHFGEEVKYQQELQSGNRL
jgi:cellulose synthase/poly-beta-1,6-N-acetylglucosamine synthase-like glycosyltransferase